MKTLEQLGISPAPWSAKNLLGYRVFNHERFELCDSDSVFSLADARLIAAAPELYEALYEAVKEKCTECHEINDYESDIGIEWKMCKGCPVKKWRAALAKASGESEVRDGR